MDRKKGIERRKFIKGMGKGLVVAAYVAPVIVSFALSNPAEAKHSKNHPPGKGHRISDKPGKDKDQKK